MSLDFFRSYMCNTQHTARRCTEQTLIVTSCTCVLAISLPTTATHMSGSQTRRSIVIAHSDPLVGAVKRERSATIGTQTSFSPRSERSTDKFGRPKQNGALRNTRNDNLGSSDALFSVDDTKIVFKINYSASYRS